MRTIPLKEVTAGSWDSVIRNASRGSYTRQEYTVLDPAGRVTDKLFPNGCVVIESGYFTDVLYCLGTGEIVRIEQPDDW